MLNTKLINPQSIVVIGGSDDISKPGGKILQNIITGNFSGDLYVVNKHLDFVQGVKSYKDIEYVPSVDLAILAIPAKYCLSTVEVLAKKKDTGGYIILSAGFGEESKEGAEWESKIVDVVNSVNGSLIGPNCIGVINANYNGVFTSPIPKLDKKGCDFISASGAIAVYIMEAGISNGLTFSSVYSVGNSAQVGVEDILMYLDETYNPETDSDVKLLYMESIKKPDMLLKHASSLINKGCKIAAVKAGGSDAGGRAAQSHTGALAKDDLFVDALLKKAGIVRCFGREELMLVAGIFMYKELKGGNIAIITHAGGPAVMLTDILSNGGMSVPEISGDKAKTLLDKLFLGSSVKNPIDFLATGTLQQLDEIIESCEHNFDNIDAMCVIFGSPGLFNVSEAYSLIDHKMNICQKPIFPIFPSIINAKKEIDDFVSRGRFNFPYEVSFGKALLKVYEKSKNKKGNLNTVIVDENKIRHLIDSIDNNGFLKQEQLTILLKAIGVKMVDGYEFKTLKDGLDIVSRVGYPVVLKVNGVLHKTDVGGVALNVCNDNVFEKEFNRLSKIQGVTSLLLQPLLTGIELFAGVKRDADFGHLLVCGIGGIFVEMVNDITTSLIPITDSEAYELINKLKSKKIFEGYRGQNGINKEVFVDILLRLSALCIVAPEIVEMDINPFIAKEDSIIAVDVRIKVEK